MEKAKLKKRRTGGASIHEDSTLRKKGQKEWEGGFGFNGEIGRDLMEKAILEKRRTGGARNMRRTRYGRRAKKSGRENLVLTE